MRVVLASLYPYLFVLLFVTLPFDDYARALPNILLMSLAAIFPLIVKKADFKKLKKIPFTLALVFVGYVALNAVVSGQFLDDFSVISKIGLSVALVLLYIPIEDFNKVSKAIMLSSFLAIIFSVVKLVIAMNQQGDFEFLNSAMVIESVLIDRIYLGMLSVLSILVSFNQMRETYHPNNKYYLANMLINVLFIVLIVSRIALLILPALFILGAFYKKKKDGQVLFAVATVGLMVLLFFVLNKDLQKDILYNKYPETDKGLVANTLAFEPRLMIWECALQQAKENVLWLGNGFKNVNNELVSCYQDFKETTNNEEFISNRYNTHNQLVDMYLSSGVLGILLLVALLVFLFIRNRKTFYATALLVTLIGFMLVENVYHRQIGAYYVGFVFIILMVKNPLTQKGIETTNK